MSFRRLILSLVTLCILPFQPLAYGQTGTPSESSKTGNDQANAPTPDELIAK
jgi:hypothetical protein